MGNRRASGGYPIRHGIEVRVMWQNTRDEAE